MLVPAHCHQFQLPSNWSSRYSTASHYSLFGSITSCARTALSACRHKTHASYRFSICAGLDGHSEGVLVAPHVTVRNSPTSCASHLPVFAIRQAMIMLWVSTTFDSRTVPCAACPRQNRDLLSEKSPVNELPSLYPSGDIEVQQHGDTTRVLSRFPDNGLVALTVLFLILVSHYMLCVCAAGHQKPWRVGFPHLL